MTLTPVWEMDAGGEGQETQSQTEPIFFVGSGSPFSLDRCVRTSSVFSGRFHEIPAWSGCIKETRLASSGVPHLLPWKVLWDKGSSGPEVFSEGVGSCCLTGTKARCSNHKALGKIVLDLSQFLH